MKRVLLFLFVLFPAVVFAQEGERILSYDAFIKVNPAGDMTVTETIRVVCEGNRINHGIYRDFPTRYKDRYNNTVDVAFQIRTVLKDGKSEPWRTEDRNNGIRVYVGSKDIILRPGEYTYALTYRTDRQLGFFKKHDELYWNVTGNAWEFPIEKVTATVELPPGAEILSNEAYTGLYGEKGRDFTAGHDSQGRAVFSTTRPLALNEGLTIVVTWPKGFVQEPTEIERTKTFFAENGTTAAGAAGIVVLLVYYLFAWLKIGRDPEKGVIIPLYKAPEGFSPAAVRYVMQMGFDDKIFAAALVNMAVKGYLTIDKDTNGEYTLTVKGKDSSGLSRDEMQIAKQIFRNRTSLAVKTENHIAIRQAMNDLRKSLAVEYEKIYFLTNKGTLIPGLLISILTLVIIVFLGRNQSTAGFMVVWLSGWTAGCAMLVYQSFKAIRAVITGHSGGGSKFHLGFYPSRIHVALPRWRRGGSVDALPGHINTGSPVYFHYPAAQHPLLPPHEGVHHKGPQGHGPDRGFQTLPLRCRKGSDRGTASAPENP
jgi:hypothetical protein